MEIRILRPEEYTEALQVARLVFDYCLKSHIEDRQLIDGFYAYANDDAIWELASRKQLTLWGVFEENRIVGMSAMKSEGHITMLYVFYNFQRRGYGRKLLEEMRTYAGTASGCRIVTLNALPTWTANYFSKHGFSQMPESVGVQLPYLPMQAKTPSCAVYEKKPIPEGWLIGTSIAGLIACTIVAVGFMLIYF